jgi:DNA phosphorothioation-dependent restriction protein DptG
MIEKLSAIGDVLLMGDVNAHVNKYDLDFISNELNDNLDDFLHPNCTADAIQKHRNWLSFLVADSLSILSNSDTIFLKSKFFILLTKLSSLALDRCRFLSGILSSSFGDVEPNLYDHTPISINLLSHYIKKSE